MLEMMNYAFIDGQNLHLGTQEAGWKVDIYRFRTYLSEKYDIGTAFYFLGVPIAKNQALYNNLRHAGFTLSFREHPVEVLGKKKGNIDTDLIFEVMRALVESENLGKVFIVSGDGDYKRLVDFLVRKGKFGKMLFPNKKFASSLYADLPVEYLDYLENENVRAKIARTFREGTP